MLSKYWVMKFGISDSNKMIGLIYDFHVLSGSFSSIPALAGHFGAHAHYPRIIALLISTQNVQRAATLQIAH
jgi:hypothetical protein